MGCPAIDLDDIEKVEDEEEDIDEDENDDDDEEIEDNETPPVLDPRAGQSDVELPQLTFNPARIADMIEAFYKTSGINSTTKKHIKSAAKKLIYCNLESVEMFNLALISGLKIWPEERIQCHSRCQSSQTKLVCSIGSPSTLQKEQLLTC